MATIFRSLFGHKKSHSKDHEDSVGDQSQQRTLERDQSRRSYRSTSSRARGAAAARFHDDSMLPPTAAYHTQTTTAQQHRVRRGPKSCPGEYVEEEPASSRSFVVDSFRQDRDHQSSSRRRNNLIPSSSSMMTTSSSSHRHHPQLYQKWETSEYGSENTSPIGYQRHHPKTHHRRHQDEVEDEEDDEDEEAYEKERSRYQELKRKIRAHYDERLFNYERAQRADHRQIKELEKEKDDLVKMLLQSNAKLEKEKKKTDYFRRKWQETEQQLKMQQSAPAPQSNFGPFGFQTTSAAQFPTMFQFPTNAGNGGGGASQQRYSFIGAPMHPISSSNTPTTSAMDTTHGGAGESLVQASDVSFLAPLAVSTTLPSLPQLDHPAAAAAAPGANTTSAGGPPAQSNSFYHDDDDEDQDETKNFRDEDIEIPRGPSTSLTMLMDEEDAEEAEADMTRLTEGKDSGFSTTPDDACKAEKVAN